MLRLVHQVVNPAETAPGQSRYPVRLDLQICQDSECLFSLQGIQLECIYDLRNWWISDFFHQKHFLMSREGLQGPVLLGLVYIPHLRGWLFMTHQQGLDYTLRPEVFREQEVSVALNGFFQRLRDDLPSYEVFL